MQGLVVPIRLLSLLIVAGALAGYSLALEGSDPIESHLDASDSLPDLDFSDPGWPEEFLEKVRHRSVLDRHAGRFHSLQSEVRSEGLRAVPRFRLNERAVPVIRSKLPQSIVNYRVRIANGVRPHAGFQAPILDEAEDLRSVTVEKVELTPSERRAAEIIRTSLARDGILATLAEVLDALGADEFEQRSDAAADKLRDLGFPVDLLSHFRTSDSDDFTPADVISHVARLIVDGISRAALVEGLAKIPFVWVKTEPSFRAAEEAGEHEIGLVRLQIGGGYDRGILRGGSIDVSGQLLAAFPQADFLASAPEEFIENIHWMALYAWPVRKPNRFRLISELIRPSSWAQDNGKAGAVFASGSSGAAAATLAPRFASQMEAHSSFAPGDSFLMDGLSAAGHTVIQSPLLFQGGNLLVARHPGTDERLLFVSETEVYRNRLLGLTAEQVLQAFQIEFGVDRCVVMPALSYHLDYDMTFRLHDGKLIAFVNDPAAAARIIVGHGIQALERNGFLASNRAAVIREQLANDEIGPALRSLREILNLHRNQRSQYSTRIAQAFAVEPTDFAAYNFRCFLAAMDLLQSALNDSTDSGILDVPVTSDYWNALQQLENTAAAQRKILEELGLDVVRIPSMPDLYQSINYINGLQDRTRYLLPAIGGFYEGLDDAAAAAFESRLGTKVRIVRLYTAHIQQQHGALHCVASLYPVAAD